MLPRLFHVVYFLAFSIALVASSCNPQQKATLKKDLVACGQPISVALYTQIPAAFAGDDWKAKAEQLGIQYGVDFVKCAATDVLAILTARTGSAPSTAAADPVVIHLRAYVGSP